MPAKVQKRQRLAQFLAAYGEEGPLTDLLHIHKIEVGSLCRVRESVVTNP